MGVLRAQLVSLELFRGPGRAFPELPCCRVVGWGTVAHSIFGLRLTCFSTAQVRNAAPAVASMQVRTYAEAKATPTEVSSILEQRIRGVQEESNLAETGRVLSVGYVLAWHRPSPNTEERRSGPATQQQRRRRLGDPWRMAGQSCINSRIC